MRKADVLIYGTAKKAMHAARRSIRKKGKRAFSSKLGRSDMILHTPEAIEGPVVLTQCSPDPEACEHAGNCPANAVWLKVQEQIAEVLTDATLEILVSAPRRNGRVELQMSTR